MEVEQGEEQGNPADVEDVMEKTEAILGKNCFDDASIVRTLSRDVVRVRLYESIFDCSHVRHPVQATLKG